MCIDCDKRDVCRRTQLLTSAQCTSRSVYFIQQQQTHEYGHHYGTAHIKFNAKEKTKNTNKKGPNNTFLYIIYRRTCYIHAQEYCTCMLHTNTNPFPPLSAGLSNTLLNVNPNLNTGQQITNENAYHVRPCRSHKHSRCIQLVGGGCQR